MDAEEEFMKIRKKKKSFNIMVGQESTHLKIFNPSKPVKKRKHDETDYYFFDALVKTKDGKKIPYGKHTIQLPSKTVVFQLWGELKEINRFNDEEVLVTILKNNNKNWDITIHDN